MLRSSCVALLLAALLMLWCGAADAAPFFNWLTSVLGRSNGSAILLEALVDHKLNSLEGLADFIAIVSNSTG